MSQAVATIDTAPPEMWRGKELDLIKSQIALNCSDDELMLFSKICQRTGLDPFTKQIYAIKRGKGERSKMTIQTGIDGYRLLAARTGELAGIDDAEYDIEDGEWPNWAKVTVWRLVQGQRFAFTAKARWSEYHQEFDGKVTDMWKKFPYLMLGKCAEALALRKAFPAELSGIYTSEEMDQADYVDAPVKSAHKPSLPPPQTTQATSRSAPARAQQSEPTLDDLKAKIATLCKANDISHEALIEWMKWQKNRYNSRTWNHMDEVLKRLQSDAVALAELHLQNLATRKLLTVETLVAIIRRRSADMTKNYNDCWVSYINDRDAWDATITEELHATA